MDPNGFLPYTAPSGLPQESKLATYMNRSASTSNPMRSLTQAMGNVNLGETSPPYDQNQILGREFVPTMSYYHPEPVQTPPAIMMPLPVPQVHQENVGGTTYFYSTNDSLNPVHMGGMAECLMPGPIGLSPYATQMFAGPHSLMTQPMPSHQGLGPTFYATETVKAEIYQRNDAQFLQTDLRAFPDIPKNVAIYTNLIPIETAAPHSMATSYRATHRDTGEHYALRRLHGYIGMHGFSQRIEMWKRIDHPNVVRFHECFTTTAFGDYSLVMVYDYHPACSTLMNKHMVGAAGDAHGYVDPFSSDPDAPRPYSHQKNAILRAVASGAMLPEAVLWSLVVQLCAALRCIHNLGLACRGLDLTKVVASGCRVRIAWCGVIDVLHPNVNDVVQAQQEDLNALGRLLLSLACRSVQCDSLPSSVDALSHSYSSEIKRLIVYLLSVQTMRRNVADLMPIIGIRFFTHVEALEKRGDAFEENLAVEVDNGRLLRILIKLGVVNERPELNLDPAWSETGDRYMLKLFRDHVFHSVSGDGRPLVDQAHITYCLNQLDSGSTNKVELMSRDEQSVLVVTYAELKHCLEQAFEEVMQSSDITP